MPSSKGIRSRSVSGSASRHSLLPRAPAAWPQAASSARASDGSSDAHGPSTDDMGALAICRYLLTNHVRELLKFYLYYELLSESQISVVVEKSVGMIIASDGNQLLQNEKSMDMYISRNEGEIKKLVKGHVERFWVEHL